MENHLGYLSQLYLRIRKSSNSFMKIVIYKHICLFLQFDARKIFKHFVSSILMKVTVLWFISSQKTEPMYLFVQKTLQTVLKLKNKQGLKCKFFFKILRTLNGQMFFSDIFCSVVVFLVSLHVLVCQTFSVLHQFLKKISHKPIYTMLMQWNEPAFYLIKEHSF